MYASKELSEELFKLSGWDDKSLKWHEEPFDDPWVQIANPICPAYTAGFLLRKLTSEQSKYNTKLYYSTVQLKWRGQLHGYDWGQIADTPEDSLALLAIKLFKEGILQKEVNK